MAISLQFKEQKAPWYNRTSVCIITMILLLGIIWFSWVGIQMATIRDQATYLFTPVLITIGAVFVFIKTAFRLWKRWQTYQKFKEM